MGIVITMNDAAGTTPPPTQTRKRPWIVAVVGGVASGKSLVRQILGEWGAAAIDADQIAHEVLREPGVADQIARTVDRAVMGPDGTVDRSALARLVFGDSPEARSRRRKLEAIIHPRVRDRIRQELAGATHANVPVVVLDIPLLLEVGWRDLADEVLFVEAPEEVRRARATLRGWSDEEWRQREKAQWPAERKRASADVVVDNGGSPADLRKQLAQWWQEKTGGGPLRQASVPP
ncbi:MAG TPA: dephospho-CoA kinase [Planctomycetaceae bacterium]|nr:dephospho-CoA kinase [Planctomycetaceae bacterium]